MYTTFRFQLFSGAILMSTLLLFWTENVYSQYIPPVLGVNQLNWKPESVPQSSPKPQNQQNPQFQQNLPQLPQNVLITPIADGVRTVPPQTPNQPQSQLGTNPDMQGNAPMMPGMIPQTILYFPPPTFPDPVPVTIYVPDPAAQQPVFYGPPAPYSNMYAPPMLVQPQYFGPQPQGCPGCGAPACSKKRCKSKSPGPPGEPVIGPPTLVYPNGIVVRPKVYLPNQPFKNTIRAITP
ncbi:MAG: hypothetical protein ACRC10_10550 [Thermoguttaceae bacterium]